MHDDLIRRLREQKVPHWIHATGESPQHLGVKPNPLCQEAADAIEMLEAECEALRLKAARYEWLQEKMRGAVPLVRVLKMHRGTYIHLTSLEQLDAAMGKEQTND